MRKLQTVAETAKSGPFSEGSLRWYIFNATHNGMEQAGAIVRVGRRVYIDPDGLTRWIDAQQRPHAQAGAA